jgi:hypothetical protein
MFLVLIQGAEHRKGITQFLKAPRKWRGDKEKEEKGNGGWGSIYTHPSTHT